MMQEIFEYDSNIYQFKFSSVNFKIYENYLVQWQHNKVLILVVKIVKIFVYGTLKPGEGNYANYCEGRITNYQFAFTLGKLFDLPQGYPAMTKGNQQVYGYLLEFDNAEALSSLDELEDYHPDREASSNLYERIKQEIFTAGEIEDISLGFAWVYIMAENRVQQMRGKLILDGCWHC